MIMMKAETDTHKLVVEDEMCPWDPRQESNLGTMVCYCGGKYDIGDREHQVRDKDKFIQMYNDVSEDESKILFPIYIYDHSGVMLKTSPFRFGQGWDSTMIGFIYADRRSRDEAERRLIAQDIDLEYLTILGWCKHCDEVLVDAGGRGTEETPVHPCCYEDPSDPDFGFTNCKEVEGQAEVCKTFRSDEHTKEILEWEVKRYSAYLNGEVYRYTLYEKNECECCHHVEEELVDSCGGFYSLDRRWGDLKDNLRGNVPKEHNDLIEQLEPTI